MVSELPKLKDQSSISKIELFTCSPKGNSLQFDRYIDSQKSHNLTKEEKPQYFQNESTYV